MDMYNVIYRTGYAIHV